MRACANPSSRRIKYLNALLQRRSLREELEEQGVEVEVVERIG